MHAHFAAALVALAAAQPPGGAASPAAAANAPRFAVLDLVAGQGQADVARGLNAVVAERLEQRGAKVITPEDMRAVLGFEKQKQLIGCSGGDSCMAEIAGALGVKYVVSGQLDRIGSTFLVALSAWDGREARRFTERATSEDALIPAAEREADAVGTWAGLAPAATPAPPAVAPAAPAPPPPTTPPPAPAEGEGGPAGHLALKVGGGFQIGRMNLEYDYYVVPSFQLLAQGSVFFNVREFSFAPAGLGVKYTFRPLAQLRPYAGLVAGFSVIQKEGIQPNFTMLGGCAFVPWEHFGVALEATADTASLRNPQTNQVLLAGALNLGLMGLW